MIEFTKIRWKNLLSTGNNFTEMDVSGSLVTIVGKNGHGKSTFIEALVFGLFGKGFRSVTKDKLVNSVNCNGLLIEVEFNKGDSQFKVVRGVKPNIFKIYKDDELINENSTAKEYQKIFEEEILGCDYQVFTNIVTIGSTNYTPFMRMSVGERKKYVDKILDLEVFTDISKINKAHINALDTERQKKTFEIELLQNTLQTLNDTVTQINENVSKDLSLIRDDINEVTTHLKESAELYKTTKLDMQGLENSLNDLLEKRSEKETFVNELESLKKELQRQKQNYLDIESLNVCPHCSQDVPQEHKDGLKESFKEELKNSEQHVKDLLKHKEDYVSLQEEINDLQIAVEKSKKDLGLVNNKIREKKWTLDKLESDFKRLQDSDNNSVEDIKPKIQDIKKQIGSHVKEREQFSFEHICHTNLSVLLSDDGLKRHMVENYLEIFNSYVNKYLTYFEFFIDFNLGSNFKEVIKTRGRDEFLYNNFSEGEKMRIDMSVLFAWLDISRLKNSFICNIIVLDEIFDSSMDVDGVDKIFMLIEQMEDKTAFVISHNPVVSELQYPMIEFKLVNGFSQRV